MRIAAILACLLLTASVAAAVTYKWEDSKGVHFTDDFNAVPGELRTRVVPEDEDGVINFGKTMPFRNGTGAKQKNLQEIERMNVDRDRIVMEGIKQHQAEMINQNQRSAELRKHVVRLLADKPAIWIVPLLLLGFFWLLALLDIMRSAFTVPAHKYIWLLVILILAPFGMVIYYFFGRPQKVGAATAAKPAGLLARLSTKAKSGRSGSK